jgi:hypothetical protein
VDWFYALPPYQWLPREGDRDHPSENKGSRERHQTVPNYTMRLAREDVKVRFPIVPAFARDRVFAQI